MSHNFLLTGASGYLGGAFLSQLTDATLPSHGKLYALVRNETQAKEVQKRGFEPLTFDPYDAKAVEENVVKYGITIVFWLIDALKATGQPHFIRALAKVKQSTGLDVHFLHTSGAKIFSSLAGAPNDRPLLDNDPGLYDIQKNSRAPLALMQTAIDTNNTVIDLAEANGVYSYIFIPCIVYGESKGFGNPISIQTVAMVKAAKGAGALYKFADDNPTWPVSHVDDNASLYVKILDGILAGTSPPHGKHGYYLASSGSVPWDELYTAFAKSLVQRGVIRDSSVAVADDAAIEKMGVALGCPQEYVHWQFGGNCTLTAKNGENVGWLPKYPAEHILQNADAEVELILEHLDT